MYGTSIVINFCHNSQGSEQKPLRKHKNCKRVAGSGSRQGRAAPVYDPSYLSLGIVALGSREGREVPDPGRTSHLILPSAPAYCSDECCPRGWSESYVVAACLPVKAQELMSSPAVHNSALLHSDPDPASSIQHPAVVLRTAAAFNNEPALTLLSSLSAHLPRGFRAGALGKPQTLKCRRAVHCVNTPCPVAAAPAQQITRLQRTATPLECTPNTHPQGRQAGPSCRENKQK